MPLAGVVQGFLTLHPRPYSLLGVLRGAHQLSVPGEDRAGVVRSLHHPRYEAVLPDVQSGGPSVLHSDRVLYRAVSRGELSSPGPHVGYESAESRVQFGYGIGLTRRFRPSLEVGGGRGLPAVLQFVDLGVGPAEPFAQLWTGEPTCGTRRTKLPKPRPEGVPRPLKICAHRSHANCSVGSEVRREGVVSDALGDGTLSGVAMS